VFTTPTVRGTSDEPLARQAVADALDEAGDRRDDLCFVRDPAGEAIAAMVGLPALLSAWAWSGTRGSEAIDSL